jgi:hypothetical protein
MVKIDPVLAQQFSLELSQAKYPPRGIKVTSHRDLGTITRLETLETPKEKAAFLAALLRRQGTWPVLSGNDEPVPAHVLDEQRRRINQQLRVVREGEAMILAAADGDPVEEFLLEDYKKRSGVISSGAIDVGLERARANPWWEEKKVSTAPPVDELFEWFGEIA